ncbi:hypothetical protein [Fictibacillus halophilus]|uniref:hypothetical protein n=1 Tax=Fictibacillus halophilus TaxID=1610490 RepID=UPI001CFBFD5C|nr:hypothetical protein [Fictibacillus halophilus]
MYQMKIFDGFYNDVQWLRENSIKPSVDNCLYWLESNLLTRPVKELRIKSGDSFIEAEKLIYGLSIKRTEKKSKADVDFILEKYKNLSGNKFSKDSMEKMWEEIKSPKEYLFFDENRVSPDALAFYRPFHFAPYEDWGIYLFADKLLNYYQTIKKQLNHSNIFFQSDILLGYIVFEVFHHEFFHHIVESAATSLEIVSKAFGNPKPLYIEYFNSRYQHNPELGGHVHDPLEEALANAYAYNSFSFSSRINKGYKSILVKKFQEALIRGWRYDPPGYRSAEQYINSGYIYGATQLIAMILNSNNIDPMASSIVAKNVLLNGHTAYCTKPDIPTYLIGSESALSFFYNLIPVPNATYTNLFWHEDLSEIDRFIQEKKKIEKSK